MKTSLKTTLLTLIAAFALSACGQKGPLVLETPAEPEVTESAPE